MDEERTAVGAWIHALDDAWNHKWESLDTVLHGVTEDEAEWQHPAYATEEAEDGWPLPGTIAWHVAHLAHCKRYYARIVAARGSDENPAAVPRVPLATFAAEIEALRKAHSVQRDAIAEVRDDEMHYGVGAETPMDLAVFLAMSIRHDSWHGGQVAVIRRLFRNR